MAAKHTGGHDTLDDPSRPSEKPPSSPRCVSLPAHVALCAFSLRVCLPLISVPPIPLGIHGLAPARVHLQSCCSTEGLGQLSCMHLSQICPNSSTQKLLLPACAHAHTHKLSASVSEENYITIIVIIIPCVIMPVMPIHAGATGESPAGFLPRTSKPR